MSPASRREAAEAFLDGLLTDVLAATDEGDAAARLLAHASARLAREVGGAPGLTRALANPLYAPLCRPATLACEALDAIGATARARVVAVDARGARAAFVMSLARRAGDDPGGERSGPWQLTGLVRAEREAA